MRIEQALEHAMDGYALAFAGAGFSCGATNLKGNEPRRGRQLAQFLAARAGLREDAPLEDAAEAFQRKFGAFTLIEELRKEYTIKGLANHHLALANVPWMRVYTTNYDNVCEFAATKVGKPVQPITTRTDPYSLQRNQTACIHLNGFILELTAEALDSTFKLTETSYVTASIAESPWATRLREDARTARAVFFIGYSMYDLDVRRVLSDNPGLREKCFFVIGTEPGALLLQRIDRFGQPLAEGVEQFGLRAETLQKSYTPRRSGDLVLRSCVELKESPPPKPPSDQSVIDLFELGLVDEGAIAASISQGAHYYLERAQASKALDLLMSGSKVVALTGALGNGKTLALEALAIRAREGGYRVFAARAPTDEASLEFERIARIGGKVMLLVENYHIWLREIRSFRQVQAEENRLVVTARDSIHDVLYEKLQEICGVDAVPEVPVDKLDAREIEWFGTILDEFGLWRSLAAKSRSEKLRLLQDSYRSEFHGILLGLLESSDIGGRVQKLLADVKSDQEYLDVVATAFVLTTLGIPATVETLGDLWGVELVSSSRFRNHLTVRQLLDFTSRNVNVKSSVVAQFVLKAVIGPDLLPILVRLAGHLSTAGKAVHWYMKVLTELMRYSNLQQVLPEAGRRELAIRYYESIKSLPQSQRNPLFWLQYAIACLVEGEVERAAIYFDNAYSFASKEDWFDTYQIDNHFARFLLVEATETNLPITRAVENFRKARAIINRQLVRDRLHYPYRIATAYQDFVDRFGGQFTEALCAELRTAAERVLERSKELTDDVQRQRHVRRCVEAMKYVIHRCDQIAARKGASASR